MNEKLADILRGRTIEAISKEAGLVTVLFNDRSKMQIKVSEGPTLNMLGEGRIESVGEDRDKLILWGENDRKAILKLVAPGSSITVTDRDDVVEYSG